MKIWIIVQEYKPLDSDFELENILPYWYGSEDAALEALHEIARDLDVKTFGHEWSVRVPPEDGIEWDSYYIMELDRG